MKPRLLPLVRRFGWFIGLCLWIQCHRHGCKLDQIQAYPPDAGAKYEDHHTLTGMVKFKCRCCESVRLVRIFVDTYHNGQVKAYLETGKEINLIP